MPTPRNLAVATALLALVATGCSTKSAGDGNAAVDGVELGPGMTESNLKVGVITDLSGPFAVQGMPALSGIKVVFDQINDDGGICGRFAVELEVQDSGSDVQKATQAYAGMEDDVLALAATLGAPINTALLPRFTEDQMVNVPFAWGRSLMGWEGNVVPGGLYDSDMANGLDYLLDEGLLQEGDTIGHLYFTGEYGENGLAGAEHVADARQLTVVRAQVNPTDTDMTAHIQRFADKGVDAIALSVAPGHTASAVSAAAAQNLEVPIVMNVPAYSAGLLEGPAGATLKEHGYVSNGFAPWFSSETSNLDASWREQNTGDAPSGAVTGGAATAEILRQILEKACQEGDMTRKGLLAAKRSLTSVETGGLTVPLDISGGPTTNAGNIARPDDAPAGLSVVRANYTGLDSANLE